MKPIVRWIAGAIVVGVPVLAFFKGREPETKTIAVAPTEKRPRPIHKKVEPSADQSLYGLQALIEFDTLDGADYDPATKTLILAGHDTLGDRVPMVPYLGYLAGALEATEPTFSLDWIPESKQALDRARKDPGFLQPRDKDGNLTPFGVWLFHDVGGAEVTTKTSYIDAGTQLVERGGFEKAFAGKGVLHLPPSIVPTTFPAVPMARPIVKGMPETSLLADLALEADVAAKSLVETPALAARVPGYQPYSEWERTHGEVAGSQRVEIRPARFAVTESADGKSMRFTRAEMAFTVEQMNGSVSKAVPSLTQYAQLLSSEYDALAREVPVLHQLREGMKILAVVKWAKRHGWNIELPAEGRPSAPMPESVPGVVHILLTIDVKAATLKLRSILWEAGGVDLRFTDDNLVVRVGDVQPYPVVSPIAETNEQLRKLASKKIEVPLPEIPGWTKQATGGRDAQQALLAIKPDQIARCKDPAAVNRQLEVVKRKAATLEHYDRAINDQTKDRVHALAELQDLQKRAKDKRNDIFRFLVKKGGSLMLSVHNLDVEWSAIKGLPSAPEAKLMQYTKTGEKIEGLIGKLLATANREDERPEYQAAAAEELTKDLAIFKQFIEETQLSTWFLSRWVGARINLLVTLTYMIGDYSMKLMDLQSILVDVEQIDDQMGRAAQDSKQIQGARQDAEDDFLDERNTLSQMLGSCAR